MLQSNITFFFIFAVVVPEVETRPEVYKPVEIHVSLSANREGRFGATRPYISDTATQYVTADIPETAAFHTSREITQITSPSPKPPPSTL